jgi:hypothetical protein
MPNIKLSYLYRDAANYKNHSFIILNNPTNIELAEIENLIHQKLIDDTWFYVDKWNLPDLHLGKWDNEIDHTWHEFDGFDLQTKQGRSIYCTSSELLGIKAPFLFIQFFLH